MPTSGRITASSSRPILSLLDSVIWLRKGEADTQAALDKIVKELHASGKMIEFAKANRLPSIGYMEEQKAKLSAAQ